MFTFRANEDLKNALRTFYEAEKVTPRYSTAHRLSDGSYLITGKTMTGFANVEEGFADNYVGKKVMPWHIEDTAKERGANYSSRPSPCATGGSSPASSSTPVLKQPSS